MPLVDTSMVRFCQMIASIVRYLARSLQWRGGVLPGVTLLSRANMLNCRKNAQDIAAPQLSDLLVGITPLA